MINLAIIEDEPIMRSSLRESFQQSRDVEILLSCPNMETFLAEAAADTALNTVLLDINLPGMSGLDGISAIQSRFPEADIIMLTNQDDTHSIIRAIEAGAISYISKKKANPIIIRDAVYIVNRGGSFMSPSIARKLLEAVSTKQEKNPYEELLTARQKQIVQLLTDGLTYQLIADELGVTIETVRDHIKKIYRKLQVTSRSQLISVLNSHQR